ncbi:hypothetical protein B1400_1103 [Bifidobacterium italicum]|uniref:Uncharacterized protein n=1 Tax=Bifidobacterium italicum TaxID=1960968 RepID=A0A2A2EJU8_9BIFI|nr:hypothetical protein [Bifidobacterium italicum]PAU69166.1 hypothetical protein B1400_1103 [Bifidobacterium italicum]
MTTATTNTNIDSDNMNTGATNGGATKGASSDGDLDFQGTANAAGEGSRCGCGCTKDDAAKQADRREGTKSNETPQPAEPVNPFPPQQAPSGDGTGVKAGGEQAE